MREPPAEISREKVLEMDAAFAKLEEERGKRIDAHLAGKSGPPIINADVDLDVSRTDAWMELKGLWWGLTQGERVSLVALAWFTRDPIANWPRAVRLARENSDMHSTKAEHYGLWLGRDWLKGLDRWEAPPGHVWIGRW